jgi:hypothetical protein
MTKSVPRPDHKHHAPPPPSRPLSKLFKHPPRPAPHGEPADVQYVLEITLVDTLGAPVAGAEISLVNNNNGNPSSRYSDGGGYTNHSLIGRPDDLVTFQLNGFKPVAATEQPSIGPQYLYLGDDPTIQIQLSLDSFKQGYRPSAAIPRSPLPPYEQPINYRTTLAWSPVPVNPDRDFHRGDAWSVVMPGFPWVPGASNKKPEQILSWFVDRYTLDLQKQYLEVYNGYGYTHFTLSYADSCGPKEMPPTAPPGNGRSLEQFIETCALVKRYVKYCRVMIGSKYFQPSFMTAQQWADFADPIMDALIKAKVVDEFALGWEMDLWNTPGQVIIDSFRHCGQKARAAGLSSWMHFSPHTTSWFADGDPRGRFGFYDDLHGDVDGVDYQSMGPYWSPAMLQARIVDSLWVFGTRSDNLRFRLWEDYAFFSFDNDEVTVPVEDVDSTRAAGAGGFLEYDFVPSPRWGVPHRFIPRGTGPTQQQVQTKTVPVGPDYANLRSYLGCCTVDNVKHSAAKVHGYGNGGRLPDGSRL